MTRFFTFLLTCTLLLFFGCPEAWGQCGFEEIECGENHTHNLSEPNLAGDYLIYYNSNVEGVDEIDIEINSMSTFIDRISIHPDCNIDYIISSQSNDGTKSTFSFENVDVSNTDVVVIVIRYNTCPGELCDDVYSSTVEVNCEQPEPLKEICDDPVTLRCGRTYTANDATHRRDGNSELNCSGDPGAIPSFEGTSYRVNTAGQDILNVRVEDRAQWGKIVYVLSGCNGTQLACGFAESSPYISGEINVSEYNSVYIFVEYLYLLCQGDGCSYQPEHRIEVTCEERDPTENCEDLSPYCHDNFKIYPSLSDPGSYTIEYDLPDNIGAEPYSWTVSGTTVEDDGASLERNFQGGRSHEICFQYLHEEYEFGSGTCSMCCMEFCPPENLLDCDVIEVVDRGGGLKEVAVPEEKNGQEIHIINWYAHRANGSIIYEFEEGERDTWNAAGFPPTAMTQGDQPIYFTLAYRLGNDNCIRICCICYDPSASYDGSIAMIPSNGFFKPVAIEDDVKLISSIIADSNGDTPPVGDESGDYLLSPGETYTICCLIKDGNCYRWMCFDFCMDDYESCGRIALEGTSGGNLTYGFTGSETLLTWFTADGSNRTAQNGAKGVVPDSYARGDGKIYCLYRDSENDCVRLCCYDGRCTPYTPESFNDYRGEVDCEEYPMALPFRAYRGPCDGKGCILNLNASSSMGSNLEYRWRVYYSNEGIINQYNDIITNEPYAQIEDNGSIVGVELQVSNSCGSSTVYISCSDFYNRCLTFDDIGSSFFDINETEPLEVDFSSDFHFGDGAQYEIEFGDGTSKIYSGSSLGTVTHGYDRPGDYYICVKVRYYCDVEEEDPVLRSGNNTTRNCCEIIFCKFIRVGCTETRYDCDIIEYSNISMGEEGVRLDLSAATGFGGGKWLINGDTINGSREYFAYGTEYHCCYEYFNEEGCLVRCCRKFRFDPQEECELIKAEFKGFAPDDGRPTFDFSMKENTFEPLAWTVSGVTKFGSEVDYTLNSRSTAYEICVLYYDEEGCLQVCCFCLRVPPYYCEDSPPVTFQYEPSVESEGITYRFEMEEEEAEPVEWYLVDESDERIGVFSEPLITCPPAHAGKRLKVYVLYRSGNCYYYRCIPVVFEDAELCELLEETDVVETGDTRVSYTGFDDVIDSYWLLNGERVDDSEGELSVDLCCLDPLEENTLCFYYKVDYDGEYCAWKVCCIDLEGEGCHIINPPVIEDLYFEDDVFMVRGRRASSSRKSGINWVCTTDTIFILKNKLTGEADTLDNFNGFRLPSDGEWELCTEVFCIYPTYELLRSDCIDLEGGAPGSCEVRPMAMPFKWKPVENDPCSQTFPVKCNYEFDASLAMGDGLIYNWSVYYPDTANGINNPETFSSKEPVTTAGLAAGFVAIKLTVANSCGSSTFYMECSDWENACIDLSSATPNFFNVDLPEENGGLTVGLSSDFAFPTGSRIEIDFGDSTIISIEDPSDLQNYDYTYEKAGVYYVCLRIWFQCEDEHGELSDSKPNCCEIILCKYIKVGCIRTDLSCNDINYQLLGLEDGYAIVGLFQDDNATYSGDWKINGDYVSADEAESYRFEYGKTYYCCLTYVDEDGCLVECCRKIKIDPPFSCDLIRSEYLGVDENGGYRFDFRLNTDFQNIEGWGVRGGGFENLSNNSNLGSFSLPPSEEPYEICVIYYDEEGCLKICCYCLYIEPEYCPEFVPYEFISSGPQGLAYSFDLDIGEEGEAVSWMLKNESGETLDESSDNVLVCPEPETGNPLEVCVLYKIGDCYYFKCIPVILEDPELCESLEAVEISNGESMRISYTGDETILESFWVLNGEEVEENTALTSVDICCLSNNEPNTLCYYYKVQYGEYCIWRVCCIDLGGIDCDLRPIPLIEDLVFQNKQGLVPMIRGRRASSSRKSGISDEIPCYEQDTIYYLKNKITGDSIIYNDSYEIDFPGDQDIYELCIKTICVEEGRYGEELEKSCFDFEGGLPGECELKPMAMPFTWERLGDQCSTCPYRFDAGLSMGDDLTYTWTIYYPDSIEGFLRPIVFSGKNPVINRDLPGGFDAVKLTVANNCGTSTFYASCTDWNSSCFNLQNASQDFLDIVIPEDENNLEVTIQSGFPFIGEGTIEVDFGDGHIENYDNPGALSNLTHEYSKAGLYYVCVKIKLICSDGGEGLAGAKCCEIILCKFIEVGCIKKQELCSNIHYRLLDLTEGYVEVALLADASLDGYNATWKVNGRSVSADEADQFIFEYGETYYCCLIYVDEDGCLVECCRKIKIDPPFSCDVIRPEFQGIDEDGGYRFDFSLATNFEDIEGWGVRGGGFENLSNNAHFGSFSFQPSEEPYEICVIYYDEEGCLKICCYCLYIEPEYCPEVVPYEFISSGPQGLAYSFDLDIGDEGEAVSWMLKNESGETLDESSDNVLICPEPETGNPLEVCVLYKIGDCYYFKCMPVVCRNPVDCDLLTVIETDPADPATEESTYEIWFADDFQVDDSYWTVNGERVSEGASSYSLDFCCPEPGRNEICFYYKIGCTWYVCCTEINPFPCNEHFDCDRWFRPLGGDDQDVLAYTYDNAFVEVSKIEVNGELVSENERELHLPVGEYDGPIEICYYIIGPGGCIYVCCKTIDPSCECPPDVDPLYCENFNDDVGEDIGIAEPDWWTSQSHSGVILENGMAFLDIGSGQSQLDLRGKIYNYLSAELDLGNCNNSIGFDFIANAIDDEGGIVFPNNGATACFYQSYLVGNCEPFPFDRTQQVLLELVGDDIKSVRINGAEVGRISAPELLTFSAGGTSPDCFKIKEICIGNRKREIPDYCGNQITESLYTNDFETFADGDWISVVDPSHWIAVNGLDAQVFEGYIFPDKQLAFQTGGGVNSDVILQQDEQTSGKYRIRWDMAFYDPDQGEYRVGDYYVIDNADPNDATRRRIWVAFDGDPDDDGTGEGTVHDLVNNQQYAFTYPVNDFILWYDRTFENALDFDLNNDELEINIDGNVIQVPYTDNFAGIEYYAVQGQNQVASDFVVDNICYGRKSSGQGGGGGTPGGSNCQPSTPIVCGITHAGNNYGLINHTYDYPCLPTAMYASEKVYSFEVPSGNNGGMRLNVFDISNPGLKVIITDDCDLSKASYCYSDNSSATYRSIDLGSLSPGKYYVFIDGPLPNTYGEFKIQLSCESTDCSGAMPIGCDQSFTGDNYSGTSNVSYYPVCPVREAKCMTAPEKVYTFTPDKSGMYSMRMNIHGSADLDLFVLGSCDPKDCINSGIKPPGNDEVFDVELEAGKTYYLVVDGQFDQRSSFDILIECPKEVPCDLPYFDFSTNVSDSIVTVNVSVISGVESIDWTFGDGASVSAIDPGVHTYSESGAYTICGTAINDCGQYKICKEVIIHIPESQTGGGDENRFILYTPDGDCLPELSEQRIPVYMNGRTTLTNLGIHLESEDVEKIEIVGMESSYSLEYNIPEVNGSRIRIYNGNSAIENYNPNTPLFELIVRTGEADNNTSYLVSYIDAGSLDGQVVALPINVCLIKELSDVIRVSGVVKDYQKDLPLEGVEFRLNGIITSSGLYGEFELEPQRTAKGELQSEYNEGHSRDRINVLDIKTVKQHWAEVITLDPFRKIAADVNSDGRIDNEDWGTLTHLVGHQIDSLPSSSIWKVYPSVFEGIVSSDNDSIGSLPGMLDITPEGPESPIEYYAIKMGDVSDKSTRSRSEQKLELVSKIHQSKVSIYPKTDVNIGAMQFCIELPERNGQLAGYQLHGKFEEAFVNIRENKVFVVFAPDAVGGVDFKKDDPILSLEFTTKPEGKVVLVNDRIMPSISESNNSTISRVVIRPADGQSVELEVEAYPNPFDDYITLEVNNPGDAATGDFTLYNLLGQEVINRKIELEPGRSLHYVHFEENLSPGLYMGILKDRNKIVEFKIVKQ